ncbi:MAG: S41 family peptidase, partial [Oscillospiraceae bacterium]
NPGGSMDSVAAILDMLLPTGPIVSATDKTGKTEILHNSDSSEIIFPMTVLINGKSASSAELFAQALRDYGKAKLIGTTTLGKGSMQKIFPLNDGSALDITVGLYNPPVSPNFDGVGVKPDYEVKIPHDLEESLAILDFSADAQLKKAMEVLTAVIKKDEPTVTDSEALTPTVDGSSSSEGESKSSQESSKEEKSKSESEAEKSDASKE